jgi:hypothetical protein
MNCSPTDVYHWSRPVLEQRCGEFGLEAVGSVRELREQLSTALKLWSAGTSSNMETIKASTPTVENVLGEGPDRIESGALAGSLESEISVLIKCTNVLITFPLNGISTLSKALCCCVRGLVSTNKLKNYAGGSVAASRATHAGQVSRVMPE